ncbi:MAG: STAS domain-containing protein [Candidatus Eremiobacteraeota bacterium]|nr:STAS domain-containing protein [Candidatus Eremiobacteraeota bacterium]MBC5804137.1 STAS domain-containing protein [Candidatus Eremiobacteraeota bacterium]MBC5821810.1 STAS domain-containing protein [Candidatus Eremiobacteraeota bacterium]
MSDTLIHLQTVDGVRVATIGSEIDLANAPVFERYLGEAAADVPSLIISLAECRYIDSSGLCALARLAKRLRNRFSIVVPPGTQVRRIFDIAHFGEKMRVCASLPEALSALSMGVPA